MYKEREKVLQEAINALNKADNPWEVKVEGNSIVANWKWMDATFFSPTKVTNAVKEYTFIVELKDNGKWKETDKVNNTAKNISANGKIGASKEFFVGTTTQKSYTFGIGKNNETGETGAIGFKLDTSLIKKAVREYLTSCGWKKAGFFG